VLSRNSYITVLKLSRLCIIYIPSGPQKISINIIKIPSNKVIERRQKNFLHDTATVNNNKRKAIRKHTRKSVSTSHLPDLSTMLCERVLITPNNLLGGIREIRIISYQEKKSINLVIPSGQNRRKNSL